MSLDYMNTGCGPFLISYKYWLDSGREPDRVAFHSCASDKSCSRAIVTSYLNKYSTDCNSDGFVDCVDYVLVHKLGYKYCRSLAATNMALSLSPSSSSSSSYTSGLSVRDDPIYDTKYWKKFQKCYGFGRKWIRNEIIFWYRRMTFYTEINYGDRMNEMNDYDMMKKMRKVW